MGGSSPLSLPPSTSQAPSLEEHIAQGQEEKGRQQRRWVECSHDYDECDGGQGKRVWVAPCLMLQMPLEIWQPPGRSERRIRILRNLLLSDWCTCVSLDKLWLGGRQHQRLRTAQHWSCFSTNSALPAPIPRRLLSACIQNLRLSLTGY
jgi:hypothetical protein